MKRDALSIKKSGTTRKRLSSQDRKQHILREAIRFFSEEGFSGSTRTLAKKIGVTQPLIYRYFSSKDELVKEVYNSLYEGAWNREWEKIFSDRSRPLEDRLREFYLRYTLVVFDREWMRIYLFSGLRGLDLNRWWSQFVEQRILVTICDELRHEYGFDTISKNPAAPWELELLWSFQGTLFYYAMRRDIYRAKVHLDFEEFLSLSLENLFAQYESAARSRFPKA